MYNTQPIKPLFKMNIIKLVKKIFVKKNSFKIEHSCKFEWVGTQYGGFYVNTNNLNENSIIYSFGIGQDISFDLYLINKFNCQVYGFDPTPKSIAWVKSQNTYANFHLSEYGIDMITGNKTFYLPKNINHVSGSIHLQDHVSELEQIIVKMKTFDDILTEKEHSTIDLLKIDIEGSEYDVIDSILSSKVIIHQIVIEIHSRFFVDGKERNEALLKKNKQKGFILFAYSDRGEELSFMKIATV
jgi:FkbM family methyltransferase